MDQIPNFNTMTAEELRSFWSKWHVSTKTKAVTLVGNWPDARKIVETLACYAINKACAIHLRLEGNIARAEKYEEDCQLAYDRLPEDIRW
jgi:hypothetical protein